MLDYRLDAETEALRKTVGEFAHDVVAPQIGEFYERDEFPTAIVRQMGELGLFGLPFPEEYGGSRGGYFPPLVAAGGAGRGGRSGGWPLGARGPRGAQR